MQQTKQRKLSPWAHGLALLAAVSVGMAFFSPLGWEYATMIAVMIGVVWLVGAAVWESTGR